MSKSSKSILYLKLRVISLFILLMTEIIFASFVSADDCVEGLKLVKRAQISAFSAEESEKDLKSATKICPALVEAHYELGRLYIQLSRYEEASKEFAEAEKLKPRVEYALGQAIAAQLSNDDVRAESIYKDALGKHLGHWRLLEGLALLYSKLEKFEQAEELLRQALQENQNESSIYFNLARVLEWQGKNEEALISYQSSIERTYREPDAYAGKARLQLLLNKVTESLATVKAGLAKFKLNAELLFIQANALDLSRETSRAEMIFNGLKNTSFARAAEIHLAVIKVRENENDEGFNLLKKMWTATPDDPLVLRAYGWALLHQGKVKESIAVLERAKEISANDVVTINNLALANEHIGKTQEAKALFNSAYQLFGDAEAKKHLDRME